MKYGFKKWQREDKRNERHHGEGIKSGSPSMDYAKQYDSDDDRKKMYEQGKAMIAKGKMMMKMSGNNVGQDPDDSYGESAGLSPKTGNAYGKSDEKMSYSGRMKKGNLKRAAFKKKMKAKYESMS